MTSEPSSQGAEVEPDRKSEMGRIAQTRRLIVYATDAVTKQMMQLERRRKDGLDTRLEERTLRALQESLRVLEDNDRGQI